MSEVPRDIGEMIARNPVTGEKMELLSVEGNFEAAPPVPEPEPEPQGKQFPPEFKASGVTDTIERNGWSLTFTATETQGLAISGVSFMGVQYIFLMMVPWLGQGVPCNLTQFFLDQLIAGPFVLNFPNGFAVWARYGFGEGNSLDQAFYFFDNGNMFPLMLLTGPTPINYVPLYIDFDVINTLNTACTYYPPGVEKKSWNLAVTEFSRLGRGETAPDGNYNIMITNCQTDIRARAVVEFSPQDNAVQYVARWLGYTIGAFPLLNLQGFEIVNRDIVFVYLVTDPPQDFFGPTIRLEAILPVKREV